MGLEVGAAAHVVDDLALERVVEQAVHGEVAAPRILLGGAEDVVAGDEEVGVGGDVVAHVDRVLPEGGDLDDLAVAEEDVGEAEAAADEPAVPEDGAHLAGVGVGGEVEVLGRAGEEGVADAAPDEVGLVPHRAQAGDHLHRVAVEPVERDLRLPVGPGHLRVERQAAGRRRSAARRRAGRGAGRPGAGPRGAAPRGAAAPRRGRRGAPAGGPGSPGARDSPGWRGSRGWCARRRPRGLPPALLRALVPGASAAGACRAYGHRSRRPRASRRRGSGCGGVPAAPASAGCRGSGFLPFVRRSRGAPRPGLIHRARETHLRRRAVPL